jgi:glycosyltransferase involved in cell wall biosynthesis
MYPPHHLGGYELTWRSAVAQLREHGHEVRVLTTDYETPELDPSTPDDADVHRELQWYWRDHAFPKRSAREILRLERHNAATLKRHLRDFRPEAASWWAMGGMSLSLIEQARRAELASSFVVGDDWLHYGPIVDAWARRSRRLSFLDALAPVPTRIDFERAGEWLFVSSVLLERARDAGWRLPNAEVAHPGIDHALFDRPRAPRRDWGGRLLYCGRIDERKGIDLAIEALPMLPDATLRVVGGGDEQHLAELTAQAESLGVAPRVKFERVPRDQLLATYADADVTLFPVRWEEPFGLVPIESMAAGTPVVASGRGGSGEYLRDGANCVLFDVRSGAAGLVSAIERLKDRSLLERLHAGGLQTASRFREESYNAAVEESLVRAIRRRRPEGS